MFSILESRLEMGWQILVIFTRQLREAEGLGFRLPGLFSCLHEVASSERAAPIPSSRREEWQTTLALLTLMLTSTI